LSRGRLIAWVAAAYEVVRKSRIPHYGSATWTAGHHPRPGTISCGSPATGRRRPW
jgi:hypothetical protein